jgi:hypothetical protein
MPQPMMPPMAAPEICRQPATQFRHLDRECAESAPGGSRTLVQVERHNSTGMVVFTGIGAAVGTGIDALITRRRVIYERPDGARKIDISPLFLHGRRGVAVSVRF